MNRERARELLPIIQAFADGKTIQYYRPSVEDWVDDDINFNPTSYDTFKYRIKPEPEPEPMGIWCNVYDNNIYCYNDALDAALSRSRHGKTVKFQEVIE